MDWVLLEIGLAGTWNQLKNGFKRQAERGFSSFFANFFGRGGIFDDFSKFLSTFWMLSASHSGPENVKKSRPKKS